MLSEKLLYSFFGNNIIIGKHIQEQLKFLKRFLPEEFKGKEMHDLGCGDGKVTILLEDIFEPKQCSGYDVNQNLVKLACRRGVQASNLDLEKVIPRGELAVVWGVLHHLRSPSKFLKRITNNYDYIFMREPIKKGFTLFELGTPFEEDRIKRLLRESFKRYKGYLYRNAIFIFWEKY